MTPPRHEPWKALGHARRLRRGHAPSAPAPPSGGADYNSREGMMTAIWGPMFWSAIHMVSFNYPPEPTPEQRAAYREWLLATGRVLPCRYCRENFEANLATAGFGDAALESRDAFSRFCYRLHCVVNEMLGKPNAISFEQVRDRHEAFRAAGCAAAAADADDDDDTPAGAPPPREKGCVRPLHDRVKGRCLIRIVPQSHEGPSVAVAPECRLSTASSR